MLVDAEGESLPLRTNYEEIELDLNYEEIELDLSYLGAEPLSFVN